MRKSLSNRLIWLWEKGYLYIIFAFILYFWWLFSKNVGILDWLKEIAYFEYIKSAFSDYNTLPYYWWNIFDRVAWRPPIPGSSSFICNPETAFFSPLTPLLLFMSAQVYVKLYVFIQFLIGLAGVFALRRKLDWSNIQFRTFIALFIFSPIIFQHIAVAYFTWYNFFLFPWLVYFIAERKTIRSILGGGAVLGLIVLQGGIYIVQYLGLFFVLYELFHIIFEKDWSRIYRIVFVPLLMVVFGFVRIYTTAIAYGDYTRPWVEIDAYTIVNFLSYALIPTVTIPPLDIIFWSTWIKSGITPHDSGLFFGLAFIMLVFVIVKYKSIVTNGKSKKQKGINYHAVFWASSFLFIVSFYRIWYYLMVIVAPLDIPLFETIKNHGIRFIMGAYFGYNLLLANYAEQIWGAMHDFVKTKIWFKMKWVMWRIFYLILISTGLFVASVQIFRSTIIQRANEIVTSAYNNTGQFWLRKRMEGISGKDLDYYYFRFEQILNFIQYWVFVIFLTFLVFLIVTILLKKNQKRFQGLITQFPHIKFELLLSIPLAFSTAMWFNLGTSVHYDNYPIHPVIPPEIIVVPVIGGIAPQMSVTPKELTIKPAEQSKKTEEYIFPQIPENDSNLLEITSGNAIFDSTKGRLLVKPLDNEPITIAFKTNKIIYSLWITIIAWFSLIIYLIFTLVRNKKRILT